MRFPLLLLLLLAAFATAQASEPARDEAELLTTATIFKLGLVGIAGHISDEETALAALLNTREAQARLTNILKSAKTNEAKLYALCGLRELSKAAYDKSAAETKWNGDAFNLMRADVVAKSAIKPQLDRMRREGCRVHKLVAAAVPR
jgi:hypothetical protein